MSKEADLLSNFLANTIGSNTQKQFTALQSLGFKAILVSSFISKVAGLVTGWSILYRCLKATAIYKEQS